MKKVNINRDVVSRQNIAATTTQTAPIAEPIVEPLKQDQTNAQSQELQGSEDNPQYAEPLPPTPKRGRKTQGDTQEVPI